MAQPPLAVPATVANHGPNPRLNQVTVLYAVVWAVERRFNLKGSMGTPVAYGVTIKPGLRVRQRYCQGRVNALGDGRHAHLGAGVEPVR